MSHIKRGVFAVSLSFIIMAFGIFMLPCAEAFNQPDYQNRAITNFLDAALKPGMILQSYFYHYNSDDLRVETDEAPGAFDLSVNVSMNQFAYISEAKWGIAHPGFEVIVPFVNGMVTMPDGSYGTDSGLADIFAAFMYQSDPIELEVGSTKMPFFWRFVAGAYFPTGDYEGENLFNVGANIFTLHAYISQTIFFTPKWSFSSRWMYFIHTKNKDFGPNDDDMKIGDLFNVHFSSAYEIFTGIRLGVLGHYWVQTTSDQLNGKNIGGREYLLAVGPGIFLNKVINKMNFFLESHVGFDTLAQNRPKGNTYAIRGGIMF